MSRLAQLKQELERILTRLSYDCEGSEHSKFSVSHVRREVRRMQSIVRDIKAIELEAGPTPRDISPMLRRIAGALCGTMIPVSEVEEMLKRLPQIEDKEVA